MPRGFSVHVHLNLERPDVRDEARTDPRGLLARAAGGAIAAFESRVTSELLKQRLHRGSTPRMFHWRESRGIEVDLVVDDGARIWVVETKSGRTLASDWFRPLTAAADEIRADHPEGRGAGADPTGRAVEAAVRYTPARTEGRRWWPGWR